MRHQKSTGQEWFSFLNIRTIVTKDRTNLSLTHRHANALSKHSPVKEHKSIREVLTSLNKTSLCWDAQTERVPDRTRLMMVYIAICQIPSGPLLSLYGRGLVVKPISWQGHEIQYRAFVPCSLLPRLIKNNPPFKILISIIYWPQNVRKLSEQHHVWTYKPSKKHIF